MYKYLLMMLGSPCSAVRSRRRTHMQNTARIGGTLPPPADRQHPAPNGPNGCGVPAGGVAPPTPSTAHPDTGKVPPPLSTTPQRAPRPNPWRRRCLAGAVLLGTVGLAASITVSASAQESPDALALAVLIPNDQGASSCTTGSTSDAHTTHSGTTSAGSGNASSGSTGRGVDADTCHRDQGGPSPADFVDITTVKPNVATPRPGRDASRGSFVSVCGTNENNHRNPDNFIVSPGVRNGAHHTHDYVGNLSADAFSTDDSLAAAGTTCRLDDRSVYFWPVLRRTDRGDQGKDGNAGEILQPTDVRLEFRGNLQAKVVAMPPFLRVITGDAKAKTNGPANARAQWTCTGFADRVTTQYPICPTGSQLMRILDFASCWDRRNTDSANHRAHIIFPGSDGRCPRGTTAVPQLRMTLTYRIPGDGTRIALDSFPEQVHKPLTDHADFVNVMPEDLMTTLVACVNLGRRC